MADAGTADNPHHLRLISVSLDKSEETGGKLLVCGSSSSSTQVTGWKDLKQSTNNSTPSQAGIKKKIFAVACKFLGFSP